MEILIEVFRNTLMITSFVVVIMLFIELLNVFTHGRWNHGLSKSKPLQVLIATFLGLIPGCFGGFAAVGMWTHGAISFGALLAAMISGIGDEAFVMLVQMPEKTLLLWALLFPVALLAGWLVDALGIKVAVPFQTKEHMAIHEHEQMSLREAVSNWKKNLKKPSFTRVLLITGLGLFMLSLVGGFFEHDHEAHVASTEIVQLHEHDHEHDHSEECTEEHASGFTLPLEESWFNGIFFVLALLVMCTFFIVSDHFLEEHLWKHIIRQHVPKIAAWTFAALLLIHYVLNTADLLAWVQANQMWVLLLAVLIGIIPESGPHLVFLTLFLSGGIPFSILLANSITQDGHASLPLLAESKKGFLWVKGINVLIGLLVGGLGLLFGF